MHEALSAVPGSHSCRLDEPRTILVVRALQLGDLLCAVPALRALRNAFPRAEITLAGLPWAREFAVRFQRYVDEFVEFPGFPGLPERRCEVDAVPRFLAWVQARHYDLALQMHGSGKVLNPLTALFGARQCAGYYSEGDYCPDPERYLAWREYEHEILRYVRLMRDLGIEACDTSLEFPVDGEERAAWGNLACRHGIGQRYVCIHPGSQLPSRRWPAERYAAVADALAADGYGIVVTGTSAEATLAGRVVSAMRHRGVNLCGATTLGVLAALIDDASLVVCNDTGVSHIAAALRTPSVVVCCGSDYARWAPLDSFRHRVLYHDVPCRPCLHRTCPVGHPCATGVDTGAVVAEARRLLHRHDRVTTSAACAR